MEIANEEPHNLWRNHDENHIFTMNANNNDDTHRNLQNLQAKYTLASSPDFIPLKQNQRLVVIGDIHGDFQLLCGRLRSASCVDHDTLQWLPHNNTIIVQVGDVLDRGSRELECLELLCRLSRQAVVHGGAVVVLWGNHELMNSGGDFRCVETNSTWEKEFRPMLSSDWDQQSYTIPPEHSLPNFPVRWAACEPGGLLSSCFFSQCKMAIQVGMTVCVHAGWSQECFQHYGPSLADANQRVRDWILQPCCAATTPGEDRFQTIDICMEKVFSLDHPFWGRCSALDNTTTLRKEVLGQFPANRLVVGHRTTHRVHHCDECLWYVDAPQQSEVLQVVNEKASVLRLANREVRHLPTKNKMDAKLWSTLKELGTRALLLALMLWLVLLLPNYTTATSQGRDTAFSSNARFSLNNIWVNSNSRDSP